MSTEDEESAPRRSSGAGKTKKAKSKSHIHIGPNARAYRSGRAQCPVCDAEKILRSYDRPVEAERDSQDSVRSKRPAWTAKR